MNTRLKELRLEKGLRQKDVAEKIGVCTASYGFYENWINKPDPETLIKLADLYDVSIDYLLGLEDDFGQRQPRNDVVGLSAEEWQLVEDYRKLSPALKEMLQDTIKTWSDSTANKRTKKDA